MRLTDPAFHHTVNLSPNAGHFVDVVQTHDSPPATWLMDAGGTRVAELAASDLTKWKALALKRVERFTFKAADGQTDLYGLLHFPSNFDPGKKWPLLVSVYAGPATNGARETFIAPSATKQIAHGLLAIGGSCQANQFRYRRQQALKSFPACGVMAEFAAGVAQSAHRSNVVAPVRGESAGPAVSTQLGAAGEP